MTKSYRIEVYAEGREVYAVTADNEEEARAIFGASDYFDDPVVSEVTSVGPIKSVEEDPDSPSVWIDPDDPYRA